MSEVCIGDYKAQGINISGHCVVSINAICLFIYELLNSKILKGRTELYFILLLKRNDHSTRCFDFGLRRIHLNGCKFELK